MKAECHGQQNRRVVVSRGKIITLDFDGRDVRFLAVKGGRVLSWATLTVPPELMHQGLINDPKRMARMLNQFIAKQGVSKSGVITSVTGYRAVTRLFSLPPVKPKLLEQTVRHKAKQEMPLPIDETYLSWQIVGVENNHSSVFALAVPKLVIDRQIQALRLAKIRPSIMDLRPLSLARCVFREDSVIINLEEQSFGVIIVERGLPVIIRNVPKAGEETNLQTAANRLVRELSRTLQFYNDNFPEGPLDTKAPVYATGAAFSNPEIAKLIAERISHRLMVPQPPLKYAPDFPVTTYSANLGLAMKEA